jgi:hypothetical protein
MKVAILDDYFDTLRKLSCFVKLAPFKVTVFTLRVSTRSPPDSLTRRCWSSFVSGQKWLRRCSNGCRGWASSQRSVHPHRRPGLYPAGDNRVVQSARGDALVRRS